MRRIFPVALAFLLSAPLASAQVISTVAGGGPNNLPATAANLGFPSRLVLDSGGNIYVTAGQRVFKVDTSGTLTVVAGIGVSGFSGDGGPATNASLSGPSDVAVDGAGNLFIADRGNGRVRRVDAATGIISSIAPSIGSPGQSPTGVAVLSDGRVLWSDFVAHVIRRLDSPLVATVVAGTAGLSGFSGDGGAATGATLANPFDVAVDAQDNIFIADLNNRRIRKVTAATGQISTVAGNGTFCNTFLCGEGGLAINAGSGANSFQTATVDPFGNIFISDQGNNVVRRVDGVTGIITTVAGVFGGGSFSGDGARASLAHFNIPVGMAFDAAGNLYVADSSNNRVRRVTPGVDGKVTGAADEIISTFAGNGSATFGGDGFAAVAASLGGPLGPAIDGAGNIFISDFTNRRIRRVDAVTGIMTTFAGNGVSAFGGDNGPAAGASFNGPLGLSFDAAGNLFVADNNNQRIRRIDGVTGTITTVAGSGSSGFAGDGGSATDPGVAMGSPQKVVVDSAGNMYFSDFSNNRIRKVAGGIISTFAGTGSTAYNGDNIAAASANLNGPVGIAVDSPGNLYIAELNGGRVRKVDTTGKITTVAGTGVLGFSGDGGPATSARLNPWDVAVDSAGNLYIAESANNRVRRVNAATGVINTVAGTGGLGFQGDGGPAVSALLANPRGIFVSPSGGNLFIADTLNNRVRRVSFDSTPPVITLSVTSTLGNNGWYTSNVTVNWTVTDPESAVTSQTGCGSSSVTSDTTGTTFTCTATSAGGTASQSVTIKRDATQPDLTATTVPGSPAASGWYNITTGTPTITFFCQDATSGVAGTCPAAVTLGDGQNQSLSLTVHDQAGNAASLTVGPLNVDQIAPLIGTHGDENAVAAGAPNAVVTYTAPLVTDATSGPQPASCLPASGSSFAVGDTTVTCNASDVAGNPAVSTTFVVHVTDATPPVITVNVTGTIGNNGWYTSNVSVSWTVTDPESAVTSTTGCTTSNVTADTGGTTFTCSATSSGGTASQSVTVKRDATPPTLTSATTPASPAASGWYNIATGAPTIAFVCQDNLSGLDGACPAGVTLGDGANQSVSRTIHDQAGNPASVTVSNLKVDLTPPTITGTTTPGSPAASGWYNIATGAPTIAFSCQDRTSGVAGTCPAAVTLGDGANQSVSRTIQDQAGNPASSTVGPLSVDIAAPAIAAHGDETAEATGPSGAIVAYTIPSVSDATSGPGPVSCLPASGTQFALGNTTVMCHDNDVAGNPATAVTFVVHVVDTIAPVIVCGSADGLWHASNVSIACTASDCGSGLANGADASFSLVTVVASGTEMPNAQTGTRTVCDVAGHCAVAGPIGGNKVDRKGPSITFATPPNGAIYVINQAVAASYSCNDAGSGMGSCAGTLVSGANINTATVGSKTFTVTATDAAGNSVSETHTYTVQYTFVGFLQPTDNLPVINVASGGRTIPVKWQLTNASGVQVTDLASLVSLLSAPIACDASPSDIVEEQLTSPGSTVFRYDGTQFIFNWQTTKGWSGCRLLQVQLADGTSHYAKFNFK